MVLIKEKKLIDRLQESKYKIDSEFNLEIENTHYIFGHNQRQNKLAIASINRKNNKQVLIGTPIFDYKKRKEELKSEIQILEENLNYLNSDNLTNLKVITTGALSGFMFSGNLPVSILTGIGTLGVYKFTNQNQIFKHIEDYIRTYYQGKIGNLALKYLQIN